MTVIAEVGGDKVKNLHRLCPDIDIVGINSYGGGPSIGTRYQQAGGTKPYIVTEFGPPGVWEVKMNAWGAPPEPTSTSKAEFYRKAYEEGILGHPGLCLGSYAFTWGFKQEATATWYGMFLPDGSRLEAVDVMRELWSGKPPENRCPQIGALTLAGPDAVEPGATVNVTVSASDPENDPLTVEWKFHVESGQYHTGGDAQAATPAYPEAISESSADSVTLTMPASGGGYRLYVYVRDDHGGAAIANVPIKVKGAVVRERVPAKKVELPFVVYADSLAGAPYAPSGWMGDTGAIKMDGAWRTNPHAGTACMRFEYSKPDGWGGIVWQDPPNDWEGEHPGGYDLTGASKLTFWARGEQGGEQVKFVMGLIDRDKIYYDTATGELPVVLTAEWKKYEIDLTGRLLARIKTGFCWSLAGRGEPVTFYVDDVRYE
jgi:hypothetical protein